MNITKTIAVGFFALGLFAHQLCAQQPLPFYEPFDASYTNGGAAATINGVTDNGRSLTAGAGSTIWNIGGGSGGGDIFAHPAGKLAYPGLGGASAANVGVFLTNTTSGTRNRGFNFTDTTSGTLYASFLLDVVTAPTANRQVVFLTSTNTASAGSSVCGVFVNSSSQLQVSKNSSTSLGAATTTALTTGATNLVVVRYTWNTVDTTDDEVALWLNPGSLGVAEGSVPATSITHSTGTDFANLNHFFIQQRNNASSAGSALLLDEVRIGTTWASVTPTGVTCSAAGVANQPSSITIAEGLNARFTSLGSGTTPTYQWQLSTDNGTTWNSISGATNSAYATGNLALANSGLKVRTLVNVVCGGGSSATSSVATVTITNAVATPAGLIVDDYWLDSDRLTGPVATNNSVWFASTATTLTAGVGVMTAAPSAGASRLWLGYFVDSAAATTPVSLAVGTTLKATAKFTPTAFASFTAGGNTIRVGLFDYADGGTRVADGFGTGSTGNGSGVRGYMSILNWGTNFTGNTLIDTYARSTPTDGNLMGSTAGIFAQLGSGPAGTYTGNNAFQAGIEYTLEMSVSRTATNSTTITTTITGGALNYTYATNDTTSAFHRFDAFGFRANSLETTADTFNFSQFKVEVVTNAASAPTPIPVAIAQANGNVILTWTNATFALQSSTNVASGYATIGGATSPYTNAPSGTKKFFRLFAP
jgi:hypothetical protein